MKILNMKIPKMTQKDQLEIALLKQVEPWCSEAAKLFKGKGIIKWLKRAWFLHRYWKYRKGIRKRTVEFFKDTPLGERPLFL